MRWTTRTRLLRSVLTQKKQTGSLFDRGVAERLGKQPASAEAADGG